MKIRGEVSDTEGKECPLISNFSTIKILGSQLKKNSDH